MRTASTIGCRSFGRGSQTVIAAQLPARIKSMNGVLFGMFVGGRQVLCSSPRILRFSQSVNSANPELVA